MALLVSTAPTATMGGASAAAHGARTSSAHQPTTGTTSVRTSRPGQSSKPDPRRAATHGSPAPTTHVAPSPSPVSVVGGAHELQPSTQEAAAQARAAQLHAAVGRSSLAVEAARSVLDDAASRASAALEAYSQALAAQRQAQAASDDQDRRLAQAEQALSAQRALLGQWARQAYVEGGTLTSSPTLVTLLEGEATDDLSQSLRYLTAVGDSRSRALASFAVATRDQQAAARSAADAESAAQDAIAQARTAKAGSDAAVRAQQVVVDQLQAQLDSDVSAAAAADRASQQLAQGRRYAMGASPLGGNAVTGAVGACPGGDTTLYGNGELPVSVLCPLWGAPDEHLRADAAFAFNRLSSLYAQQFGRPICVADSYRSYEQQVAVYASRPGLAAVPGTSNHGWGTAVDLCGGIESFSTTTHGWMRRNAPLLGWFHPAWAEPGGSKPEPWHWEFAG